MRDMLDIIIDQFEDFLEERGIVPQMLVNSDREGAEEEAIIYGSDFDAIENAVSKVLKNFGISISSVYEEIPEPADEDLVIFVPAKQRLVKISEGSGSNLSEEDTANGFVDYFNYDIYDPEMLDVSEDSEDGGILLRDKLVKDEFNSLVEAVPEILDFAFGSDEELSYIVLWGGKNWKEV